MPFVYTFTSFYWLTADSILEAYYSYSNAKLDKLGQ